MGWLLGFLLAAPYLLLAGLPVEVAYENFYGGSVGINREPVLLGPLYADVVSVHSLLTYLAFLLVPAVAWLLYRSRFMDDIGVATADPAVRAPGLWATRPSHMTLSGFAPPAPRPSSPRAA